MGVVRMLMGHGCGLVEGEPRRSSVRKRPTDSDPLSGKCWLGVTPGFSPVKSTVIELSETDADAHSGDSLHGERTVRSGIAMPTEGSRGCGTVSLRSARESADAVPETKTEIKELMEMEAPYSGVTPRIEQGKQGPGSHTISSPSPVADNTTSKDTEKNADCLHYMLCVCAFGKKTNYLCIRGIWKMS